MAQLSKMTQLQLSFQILMAWQKSKNTVYLAACCAFLCFWRTNAISSLFLLARMWEPNCINGATNQTCDLIAPSIKWYQDHPYYALETPNTRVQEFNQHLLTDPFVIYLVKLRFSMWFYPKGCLILICENANAKAWKPYSKTIPLNRCHMPWEKTGMPKITGGALFWCTKGLLLIIMNLGEIVMVNTYPFFAEFKGTFIFWNP